MWRPRDHERFIGSYDPEHEMPDPDRRPRDRYESDAYRYNARDSRYPYRWNPDRFEDRFRDRDYGRYDAETRYAYERGYDRGWNDRNGGYYDPDREWLERQRRARDLDDEERWRNRRW